ncbi:hypothetical protein [Pyxidicoccus trucidator]|uniref:hypothetical protein n=1 Tax=Pyxidicoccus trucidator TaxID=2709662 RepID=UPI0013DA0413|nr:hypothetical protein [Pyxidicoccus trucidator]
MSHTNPFLLGAVCVVLGALLWMVPACWGGARPQSPRGPAASKPTRTYASVGWRPVQVLLGAR